ncbi:TetR/AcrR family transcriptional regulator C-terminal domain-containing protein [Demequina sp.]|uniref:TetR/AcrR family transcriptional regulator n=1 Tax=Demequina sp. TaxID=2050685 RepID=UPI0025BD6359|nr:TetR/AcrR family transcriptional regulator C-terminal domain-containing protein [Demequina sp.]
MKSEANAEGRGKSGATRGSGVRKARAALSKRAIVNAGVELADRDGLEPLTIRALAAELGSRPMSIYRHVESKDALLDAMVDAVIAEMEPAHDGPDWRDALRRRCESERAALVRHPWAIPLLESRANPGPVLLAHHNATLGALMRGGLSMPVVAHGVALLDSVVYGFAMQEAGLAAEAAGGGEHVEEVASDLVEALDPATLPHLTRFVAEYASTSEYSFGASFTFGVDAVLDALVRAAGTA